MLTPMKNLVLALFLAAAASSVLKSSIRQWLFGHQLLPIMLEENGTTVGDDSDPADGPH